MLQALYQESWHLLLTLRMSFLRFHLRPQSYLDVFGKRLLAIQEYSLSYFKLLAYLFYYVHSFLNVKFI